MKNALIILAGGTGKRLNNSKKIPKQFIKIDNINIIEYFLENLDNKIFDIIVIVCETKQREKYLIKTKKKFFIINYISHNLEIIDNFHQKKVYFS